jgi:hypothetical protein
LAIAARLTKYGLSIDQTIWRTPLAVVNQLIIYDELASGRKPRWPIDKEQGRQCIDDLLAEALTGVA